MDAPTPTISLHQGESDHQAGYTLVWVVVMMAVLSILMGTAVQVISHQAQREREIELIFRGGQYVEAIRLYQTKYGRLPVSLKEIWEADPKVIRRAYVDPITDSENWGIIHVGEQGAGAGSNRDIGLGDPTNDNDDSDDENNGREEGEDSPFGQEGEKIGPIIGVYSTSCDESIKILDGRERYCDWKFVIPDMEDKGGPGGKPGSNQGPQKPRG